MAMINEEQLQLYEDQPIRSAWDEEHEEWYFSIVDVVAVLTEQSDYQKSRKYWNKLKQRLSEEGNETVTNCHQLKLKAADGKRRSTDVANTEQLLRIIQSIPSKKAEPFKLWLAQVGKDRIEETLDPELIAERLVATYERKGYTREWINQRLQAISARKELTDEWKNRGVSGGKEYAFLTDELTKAWSGMTTRQYKSHKGLKKESLRDNMSTTELVLNLLAYAEAHKARVLHYTDDTGIEADAVYQLEDGRYALIEIKVGANKIPEAERSLLKFRNVIRKHNEEALKNPDHPRAIYREPTSLIVICANAPMTFTTDAGVKIVPIGCLKD